MQPIRNDSSSMRGRLVARLRACAFLALAACSFACLNVAVSATIEAPFLDLPAGRLNRTGLRLQLDWYGPSHPGYQPVRVKVLTANGAPSPRDRTLEVHVYPNSWGAGSRVFDAHKTIVLPAGATSVEDTISMPVNQQMWQLSTQVLEDGDNLEEFEHSHYYNRSTTYEESLPSVLIVDSGAPTRDQFNRTNMTSRFVRTAFDEFEIPDFSVLSGVSGGNFQGPFITGSGTNALDYLTYLHTANSQLILLHPDDLPERWIDLTCLEVAIVAWPDLVALRTARPEAFAALRDWTFAGRTLVVYGLGDGLANLPQLERDLQMPATEWGDEETPSEKIDAGMTERDWTRAARNLRTQSFGLWSSSQGQRYYQPVATTAAVSGMAAGISPATPPNETTEPVPPTDFDFAKRPANFGYVVAIADEEVFPGTHDDWRWVFNSVPPTHLSWNQKHGMSYADVNIPFWRHRIPGVGVAPVWTFLALITGFAALIGPANYFYLARKRRLALLLLTVPIGSFAVILGLFTYAFLHDGLSVRSRIRSYSIVDAERAYSWSWQTYFAGIAPSQGIVLDESSYLAPMFFDPVSVLDDSGKFEIDWNENQQRLARGYLPSRTMSQFVGNGVREGAYRVAVRFPKDGGEPTAENLLGTDLSFLAVVGPDGTLYSAPAGVGKEASVQLVRLDAATVGERYVELLKGSPLDIPEGVDVDSLRNSAYRNGFFGWLLDMNGYYYGSTGASPAHVVATKYEGGILQAQTSLERNVPTLEPGTFYAVADSPPWLPYAVEEHSSEMTLNVVHGRY